MVQLCNELACFGFMLFSIICIYTEQGIFVKAEVVVSLLLWTGSFEWKMKQAIWRVQFLLVFGVLTLRFKKGDFPFQVWYTWQTLTTITKSTNGRSLVCYLSSSSLGDHWHIAIICKPVAENPIFVQMRIIHKTNPIIHTFNGLLWIFSLKLIYW